MHFDLLVNRQSVIDLRAVAVSDHAFDRYAHRIVVIHRKVADLVVLARVPQFIALVFGILVVVEIAAYIVAIHPDRSSAGIHQSFGAAVVS